MTCNGFAPHYLVLAVHAPLNLVTLNECDNFPFNLFDTPAKRRCHAVKPNGLERLKVEYDGRLPQMLSDIVDVDSKVYVYIMSRLFQSMTVRTG